MGGMESAEHVTPCALDWIERKAASRQDWLLHVNYWDPHTAYRVPEEFGNPFADEPLPNWMTPEILEQHKKLVGPHCSHEVMMYHNRTSPDFPRQPGEVLNMEDYRSLIDGYDCGIAYMDQHIGQLLDALEKQGVMDELVIIVSSDHGENQGELGVYAEHGTADYITTRIPMIVRWPGKVAPGGVDAGLHYNLDLAPTLAEMMSFEPAPDWDGRSYADTLTGGADTGREHLVVSQCCHVCQRGVRFGPWMYIRTYHDGFHLYPDEMLFNVEEDPHEMYDLAADRPDVCAEAARKLEQWHAEMMATQPAGYTVDPMQLVLEEGGPYHARGQLKQYCEYLKKTGRQWAIPELKKRHPREFE